MKGIEDRSADEDAALKAQFDSLRRFQTGEAPTYQSIRSRNVGRGLGGEAPAIRSGWLPGLVLAAAAALMVWLSAETERSEGPAPWVAGQWAMPTDVLLDLSTLPGDHMLYEVPEFGGLPASVPALVPDGAMKPSLDRRIPV